MHFSVLLTGHAYPNEDSENIVGNGEYSEFLIFLIRVCMPFQARMKMKSDHKIQSCMIIRT